jgi:hypothetical protein
LHTEEYTTCPKTFIGTALGYEGVLGSPVRNVAFRVMWC